MTCASIEFAHTEATRRSRILEKISRGETALAVTMHLTDPSVFEMAALLGFDGIWMGMEHHGYTLQTAQNLTRAARVGPWGGSDIIARPCKGEFMRMAGSSNPARPASCTHAAAPSRRRARSFAGPGTPRSDSADSTTPVPTRRARDVRRPARDYVRPSCRRHEPVALGYSR